MRFLAATSMVVVLAAPAAFAQERGRGMVVPQGVAEKQAVELAARVPFETPVTGAPYSADIVIESSQTLADGNHISNKSLGHVYRDSEGRTRREQEGTFSVVTRTEPVVTTRGMTISIVDPVAGYSYSLNPEQKIAYRTPLVTTRELLDKVKSEVAAQRSSESMAEQTKQLVEKLALAKGESEKENVMRARGGELRAYAYSDTPLEHATIEGLAVEGHKRSETIPAGKIGNEQPIVITSEEWKSPDLKVLVLTRHNDPRTGESSYRLTNIVRAEPDRSLFIVPPDYTVRDTGIRRNLEEQEQARRR